MENMRDDVHASFLYGESGRTAISFTPGQTPVYKMLDGDMVLHLEVKSDAVVYLPPTVTASGRVYLITSMPTSTVCVPIITTELERTVVNLEPCTTIALICNGLKWYEFPITLKS